jgi:cardiolipin synthase
VEALSVPSLDLVQRVLTEIWPLLVSTAYVGGASWVTVDAVLRKRHVPSVIGWVGLAWLAPVIGALFYFGFGINRIQRSGTAQALRAAWEERGGPPRDPLWEVPSAAFAARQPDLAGLEHLGARLTRSPLLAGNLVEPLRDGDEAFPAMLAAIAGARRSITLTTYIFDNDPTGREFLEALTAAHARGVAVRVLVDDVGSRYTRPAMTGLLRRAGVPVAAFLPTRVPRLFRYANLRNHRKLMVVDGSVGFCGGMNIRHGHRIRANPDSPTRCMQFALAGPVVGELQEAFAVDWAFATGEQLVGEPWFVPIAAAGEALARGVPDGPDADIDNVLHLLIGALAVARRRVRIVTPYFVPDGELLRALRVAALRGVSVELLLPARSNLPFVDWARSPQLPFLLDSGCVIHLSGEPFDHSKLMVVDGQWSLVGSTNWDARSLRLNFEYNVECYDTAFAARLEAIMDAKLEGATRLTAEAIEARPFPLKLRDGLARLLSPYL